MSKIRWMWALVACALFVAQPVLAAVGATAQLVSVKWLGDNLERDDVLLIDASPAQMYTAKGHIPGAVNVDVFSFGGRDLTPAEMEKLIQSWGVSASRRVVIYDQGGTFLATSLLFDLYYHGFPADKLSVLDGGLAKWQATGGAITKDATPPPKPGTFRVTKVKEDSRVALPEFLVATGDPANNALVSALDPAEHFGGRKFFDRAGHIPNAVMTPSDDYFNSDKTFKSPEEIKRMLAYLGVKPGQQVYTHCGGGIAATVPFFAMKFMAGYPKVKLFKGSQLEWLRDDRGLPYWTYEAPNMTREKVWLNGWGNKMMRSFGVAKLALIDVRPEASFKQAHLPFAVNIPADVFRSNATSPAKLAQVLGAAGVDAKDEAVIVSEHGLTPDSALAYLLLERVGQKRVSVFADSLDDWAFAGFPVDKDAKASAPMAYPVSLRAPATSGLYPRVHIAAGKALPANVPEGKVIHVPYTELLTADGRPKPAFEIWNTLTKAGVPRYAELVSISDDPGEAAATYFILKMMGYPDVRVMGM